MAQIHDIHSDKSLKHIVQVLRESPNLYEKVAKISIDYTEHETLPDHAFAWPEKRAYAIHGKDAAYLSAVYRTQCPPEFQGIEVPAHVDENLEKAAYLYDFPMPSIKKKVEVKVASLQDDDYLLKSLKRFPVRSKEEGLFTQDILVKNAHVMGYDHLSEACAALVTKMASYNVSADELHPAIYKYAGLTQSNKETLEAAILHRNKFVKEEAHKEAYCKLAAIVDEMDFNRDNLTKIASTLETLDEQFKVRHLYDKHLLNPIESVFNTNKRYEIKTASEEMFSPEMAARVTEDQLESILGDDVVSEAKVNGVLDKDKLVEVVNSLPREMVADLVERI